MFSVGLANPIKYVKKLADLKLKYIYSNVLILLYLYSYIILNLELI